MSPHLSDHGPNVALLKLTLCHIDMNKVTWDQETWRRCFGGWACTFAGGRWYAPANSALRDALYAEDGDEPENVFPLAGGRVIEAYARAHRVLGLTWEQSNELTRHTNTLPDLHRIVDEICAGVAS